MYDACAPVDPVVHRWWVLAEYMETNPDHSPKTWPLEEMFWMEAG
jgi:hypothetical protein